jgi:predicted chitinase
MSIPSNIYTVIQSLKKRGITNNYVIGAILAIVYKESGFKPQSEVSYKNTSNARIRTIFSKTQSLTDAQLTELKQDDFRFFNYVYGNRFGNGADEGYKYRGRGFNQLTFKGNYLTYQNILGLPLVNNPDLVNQTSVAAEVLAAYFVRQFEQNKAIVSSRYGASNINDFKDLKTAYEAVYNANAGFGKDTRFTDPTGGKAKGMRNLDYLMGFVLNNKTTLGIGAILLAGGFFF